MMDEIRQAIALVCKDLFNVDVKPELTRAAEQFGDYSTNVALQLAGKLNKKPNELAEKIIHELKHPGIDKASVAGGFINITLTDKALIKGFSSTPEPTKASAKEEKLVEFGDPNPFKAMHLGHLYTAVVGEAIARLIEASGSTVERLSYHGDVGMHVAKCIWAVGNQTKWSENAFNELLPALDEVRIGHFYAEGAKTFDDNQEAAEEIKDINESVYKRDRPEVNLIYDKLRDKSFEEFDKIFARLGINYTKRYLESEVADIGVKTVEANTGKVFRKSEGAVIYEGEKAGLHTRVFINSRGLPTYETKDLGLAIQKNIDFPEAKRSIVITASEQSEYFKVMLAALSEIDKTLADKTTHLAHGFLSLTAGKMSSRSGNIYAAYMLLDAVHEAVKLAYPEGNEANETYLAAVKYALLKHRIGADIIFDVQESISLEGNSGPYLQYAHARAKSILRKASKKPAELNDIELGERSLVRKISEYPEVVDKATSELMPHHICTYLYELAQSFNSFYEHNRVVGDKREAVRLQIVGKYAEVLKNGLAVLNISAPEKI